jgi:steroid delta-isomerase-like uncharacterized protein
MSVEENKALIRAFYEMDVKESLDKVDELFHPEFVYHTLEGDTDREGYKQGNAAVLAAFPDCRYTLDEVIAEGDKVVERWTMVGTHQSEFSGIPATNKMVTFSGVSIDRFEGDKVAETWVFYNPMSLLQQLGAFPPPNTE